MQISNAVVAEKSFAAGDLGYELRISEVLQADGSAGFLLVLEVKEVDHPDAEASPVWLLDPEQRLLADLFEVALSYLSFLLNLEGQLL